MPTTNRRYQPHLLICLAGVFAVLACPPDALGYFFPDAFVRRGKVPPTYAPPSFPPGDWVPKPPPKGPPGIDPPVEPPDDNPPPEVVPEPASLLFGLIGLGAFGLAQTYRHRRQASGSAADDESMMKNP